MHAEEVEARVVADAPLMPDIALLVEVGHLDPGVVGPVPGRPDDGVGFEGAPVVEGDRWAVCVFGPGE
jgi:hypothetical protein